METLQEKCAAGLAAYDEARFPAENLAEELAPLLDEYFIGTFQTQQDRIVLTFPNGQCFQLTVSALS